jgi:hypothetical protein
MTALRRRALRHSAHLLPWLYSAFCKPTMGCRLRGRPITAGAGTPARGLPEPGGLPPVQPPASFWQPHLGGCWSRELWKQPYVGGQRGAAESDSRVWRGRQRRGTHHNPLQTPGSCNRSWIDTPHQRSVSLECPDCKCHQFAELPLIVGSFSSAVLLSKWEYSCHSSKRPHSLAS